MKVGLFLTVLSCPAALFSVPAFTELATNRDGSVLLFSSYLSLRGSPQAPRPKIFAWDAAGGVRAYDQREPSTIVPGRYGGSRDMYRLFASSLSADGLTTAVTATYDCPVGGPCLYSLETYESIIRVRGRAPITLPGRATVSPNGRYAISASSRLCQLPCDLPLWWVDLQTGETVQTTVSGFHKPSDRHGITNDGTVLRAERRDGDIVFVLWRPDRTRPLPALSGSSNLFGSPLLNAAGTKLVVTVGERLVVYDFATGTENTVWRGEAGQFSERCRHLR